MIETWDDARIAMKMMRALRGLNQADVAVLCGTSQSVISQWEAGIRVPIFTSFLRWAKAVGLSVDLIVEQP